MVSCMLECGAMWSSHVHLRWCSVFNVNVVGCDLLHFMDVGHHPCCECGTVSWSLMFRMWGSFIYLLMFFSVGIICPLSMDQSTKEKLKIGSSCLLFARRRKSSLLKEENYKKMSTVMRRQHIPQADCGSKKGNHSVYFWQ